MNKSSKRIPIIESRRLILGGFRLATLALALVELAFDPPASSLIPVMFLAIIAISYTGFKLIHPFRWYLSSRSGKVLIAVDVAVCAFFLLTPRIIHTSFALYSLNPVLISALLFRPRTTWITGATTTAYFTVNFFSFPLDFSLEFLNSIFVTHVLTVGLITAIPYLVSSYTQQSLISRTMADERRKLGREIHDGICQTLCSLRLDLQMMLRDTDWISQPTSRLQELKSLVDEAEKEAREYLEILRSIKLDRPFLLQVEDSLKYLENKTGISYRLEADTEPPLDDLVKLEVLAAYEEALRNVAKHSGARLVKVRVITTNGRLELGVTDDGTGIFHENPGKGQGLMIIKERVESIGGNLQVSSTPGSGTEIRIEVPAVWHPKQKKTG